MVHREARIRLGPGRAPRRRLFLGVALLLALASCASGPRHVDIPRDRLQAALERRFPFEARPGGLLVVQVAVPRLDLDPAADRLRLAFDLEAADRLGRSSARGHVAVSFGLRYDAADHTVRATGVRVERIELEGVPDVLRAPLQQAGRVVAQNLLEGVVLHAFAAEEVARARGWTPGALRVTADGIRVELWPPAGG